MQEDDNFPERAEHGTHCRGTQVDNIYSVHLIHGRTKAHELFIQPSIQLLHQFVKEWRGQLEGTQVGKQAVAGHPLVGLWDQLSILNKASSDNIIGIGNAIDMVSPPTMCTVQRGVMLVHHRYGPTHVAAP